VSNDPRPARLDKPGSLEQAAALQRSGQLDKAEAAYRSLLGAEPDNAEACARLGRLLVESRRSAEAEPLLRRAIAIAPRSPPAFYFLGRSLQDQQRLTDAIGAYEAALALDPGFADAVNNLASIAKDQGRHQECLALYDRAVELRAGSARIDSNRLLALHYANALAPADQFREHERWAARHAAAWREEKPEHANTAIPERRLRIGYASPDFGFHPVGHLIGAVLRAHDRTVCEVFGYSVNPRPNDLTAALQGVADHWRDAAGLDDDALAARIRGDAIDILVDLAGHTRGNRLLAFARKPAPVQVTYLGYPGTTGLSAIGYRITDAIADPPDAGERLATETLLRLAGGFIGFSPPQNAPAVAPLPALASGAITFGSFNNLAKLSDGA